LRHCAACGDKLLSLKTRPSAQYNADGLASPDIQIGLRHPVTLTVARECSDMCGPFHIMGKSAYFFVVAISADGQQRHFVIPVSRQILRV
jgi:hypothetical protein